MPLDDDYIKELTLTVWSTLFGLEASEATPAGSDLEEIRTSVDITGAWEGTISLAFSRSLGRQLTAVMLACKESEATPDLIRDAVGELANVLGGNVKGMLPGPCALSLPRVEAGPSSDEDQTSAQRLWFDCAGQPFSVTVRSRAPQVGSQL